MAVTAKFIADFSGFLDAVTRAETKLRDFGSGAASVEKSLNRMVDNFSGRKLIEDATKSAEAVERIGGASKLTDAELQQVAKTAAEAADKMKRLGIEVPPKIAALAGEVKGARTAFDDMKSVALSAGAAIAAAFTVNALAGFESESISAARQLRNLGIETRISTDELQVIGAAASAFGADSEQLGRAIFQLSRRIAGGDESAVAAIHQMGIGLDDVKHLEGEELFLKMARGLNAVQGSLKDTTAADLFGARLGASMIAVSGRLDETIAKVRQSNVVMSKEAVEAAAKYADALDNLSRSAHAVAVNVTGPLIDGLNVLSDATTRSASRWDVFKAVLMDMAGTGGLLPTTTTHLATLIDKLNRVPKDIELPKERPAGAGPSATDAEIFAKIQLDAMKGLTAAQEKYLTQLFDIGQLNAKNAASFGVNAEQMELFKKKEEEIIQAQATMATQLLDLKNLETEVWKNAAKATDEANKATQRRLDLLDRVRVEDTIAGNAAVKALGDRTNPKPTDPFNKALDARDEARRKASEVDPNLQTSAGPSVMAALLAKAEADFDDAIAAIQGGGQKIAGGLGNVADVTHAGAAIVSGAFQSIQMAANAAVSTFSADRNPANSADAYLQDLSTQGFRNTQGLGATLFSLANAPRRAMGGSVSAGSPYMVGERGPELFTPTTSGSIAANGSGSVHVTISVNGLLDPGTIDALSAKVGLAIAQKTGLKLGRA